MPDVDATGAAPVCKYGTLSRCELHRDIIVLTTPSIDFRAGPSCYRKNPEHFVEFSHPWLDADDADADAGVDSKHTADVKTASVGTTRADKVLTDSVKFENC